jgi:hypothetical protein
MVVYLPRAGQRRGSLPVCPLGAFVIDYLSKLAFLATGASSIISLTSSIMPSIAPHFLPRASFPRRSVGILSRHSIRPDNDPRGVLWSRGGPSRGLAAEVERTIAAKATGETYRSLELSHLYIGYSARGARYKKSNRHVVAYPR